MNSEALSQIRMLHTLGPKGTNCEKAAFEWFNKNGIDGEVMLYATLEQAVENMPKSPGNALLGCVAYPELHTLVFSNLDRLDIAECFVMSTFSMVLASGHQGALQKIATHPAPQRLVPEGYEKVFVTSNAEAAVQCSEGAVDGCITTIVAANARNLKILEDFGEIPMGFSIHVCK